MTVLNSDLLVSTESDKEDEVGEALEQMIAEKSELDMETLADRKVMYEQNANQLFGTISGLVIFIMTFSILSMMNTLITNIVTRKQELAMLESIGMSKGQIRKMLLGESLLLVIATVGITMTVGLCTLQGALWYGRILHGVSVPYGFCACLCRRFDCRASYHYPCINEKLFKRGSCGTS